MEQHIPFGNPSPELGILLQGMKGQVSWPAGADRSRFCALVKKNRLEPLMAEYVRADTPFPWDENSQTMVIMAQVSMLGHLAGLFEAEGIRALSVKGPAMAAEVYATPALRSCNDLDFLIPPCQLAAAMGLLHREGWHWQEVPGVTTPKRFARVQRIRYHFTFTKEGYKLELHWRLPPWDAGRFEDLWENRRQIPFGGSRVCVPAAETQCCYQVMHNVRHGFHRLKWLADMVWMLPGRAGEMESMWQRLKKDGQQLTLLAVWLLMLRLPRLAVPDVSFGGYHLRREQAGVQVTCSRRENRLLQRAVALTDELLVLMEAETDVEKTPAFISYRRQLPPSAAERGLLRRFVRRMGPGPHLWTCYPLPDRWYFLYWLIRPVDALRRRIKA